MGSKEGKRMAALIFLCLITTAIAVFLLGGCVTTKTSNMRVLAAQMKATANCGEEYSALEQKYKETLAKLINAHDAEINRLRAIICPVDGRHVWVNDVCVDSQGK